MPPGRHSAAGATAARFMLGTDTCSYIMKRSHPPVLKRLQSVPVGDVCMSVVSKAELLYGVEVSPRRAQDAAALAAFLPYVEVVALDDDAALHYAEIRADLKRRGALHRRPRARARADAGH
jgi:tRNA(fMet)-specific endonuclease VapC